MIAAIGDRQMLPVHTTLMWNRPSSGRVPANAGRRSGAPDHCARCRLPGTVRRTARHRRRARLPDSACLFASPRSAARSRRPIRAALAEPWDTGIGLTCGDPDALVRSVLFAVDVDPVTVAEAVDVGAQLLVTHHPLLFRAVQSVAADTPKGRLIHRMLRHGIGHYAAHTNADRADGGVNDALAGVLGLTGVRPLQPATGAAFDKLVVMVPRGQADVLLDALERGRCGAGRRLLARRVPGGRCRAVPPAGRRAPGDRARSAGSSRSRRPGSTWCCRGAAGTPSSRRCTTRTRTRSPGSISPRWSGSPSAAAGLGRVGELPAPLTATAFAELVASALPATVTGARLAGDPHREVRTVAVCGGAGGSLLDLVAGAGVDAFVTADLSHHLAAEFVADPRHPVLVDVAHWASEWPWLPVAADLLTARFGAELAVAVSSRRTDPWTARRGSGAR